MSISVDCPCGRSYQVPEEQRGRKLECKICGLVTRIGSGLVEPKPLSLAFSDSDESVVGGPSAAADSGPGSARTRDKRGGRRCPSCDERLGRGARVCIACGYDLETGRGLADGQASHEQRAALVRARQHLAKLERQSALALTPLGLVLAPLLLLRSLGAASAGAGLRAAASRTYRHGVWQARGLALVAGVFWWVVASAAWPYAALYLGASRDDHRLCRGRLTALAEAVRGRLSAAPGFPTRAQLGSAGALAELEEAALSRACPASERGYLGRFATPLTKDAALSRWLLWDPRSHVGDEGLELRRVVTLGGRLLEFEERSFQAALKGAFKAAAVVDVEAPGVAKAPAGIGEEEARRRVLAFAKRAAPRPTLEDFEAFVGTPALGLLRSILTLDGELPISAAALDLAGRLPLDAGSRRELAELAAASSLEELRFSALALARSVEDDRWLSRAVELLATTDDGERRQRVAALLTGAIEADLGALSPVLVALGEAARGEALLVVPEARLSDVLAALAREREAAAATMILLAQAERALPLFDAAFEQGDVARRRSLLTLALEMGQREESSGALDLIRGWAERLELGSDLLVELCRGLARLVPEEAVELIVAHYEKAPERLKTLARQVFDSAVAEERLAPVVEALSGATSSLAARSLRRAPFASLKGPLKAAAGRLKGREARLGCLALLRGRLGPEVTFVLGAFGGDERADPAVIREVVRAISALPANPRDKRLLDVVGRVCKNAARSQASDREVLALALRLMGLYQSEGAFRELQRFLTRRRDAVESGREALKSLSRYNKGESVSVLAKVHAARSGSPVLKKRADALLREITGGDGKPSWAAWLRKNRGRVRERQRQLEVYRRARLDRLEAEADRVARLRQG